MTEANVASQPTFHAPAYHLSGANGIVPLDASPRIAQWQQLQFGLFLHWGIYSTYEGAFDGNPQKIGYPEQIKAWMNIPDDHYLHAAHNWTAQDWDAAQVCRIAKDAGMSYIMITTKHHDGFCMWDTATTDFNIVKQSAFGRDPLKELATECAAQGLKLAFYFSIIDWTQHEAEPYANLNAIPQQMMPYVQAQITELLTNYGPIAEFWFDMGAPTPAQSQMLADTVRTCQPETTVMNSRVWNDRGDFEVGGDNDIPPFFQYGPWESVRSIFPQSWSYCSTDKCDRSPQTIPTQIQAAITDLVDVITGGGQFAYNLGPMPSGGFDPFDMQVMAGIGQWMRRHPQAISGARPTWIPIPEWGRISSSGSTLFLFPTRWDDGSQLRIPGVANAVLSARIDTGDEPTPHPLAPDGAGRLPVLREGPDILVTLSGPCPDPVRPVVRVELDGPLRVVPSQAGVLKAKTPGVFRAQIGGSQLVRHRTAKGYSGGFAAVDAYIANPTEEDLEGVSVTLRFAQGHEPRPGSFYRVTLADLHGFASGESVLAGAIQTPWRIPANSVERFRVEYASVPGLYQPYYAASLDFTLEGLDVCAGTIPCTPSAGPSSALWDAEQLEQEVTHVLAAQERIADSHGEHPLPSVSAIRVETVMGESMQSSGDGANRIVTVDCGTVLGCSVDVAGDPYPSIQWQILHSGDQEWQNLEDQTAPTWTRVTDQRLHQAKLRVLVSHTAGSVTSGMVTINLT